MLGMLGRSSGPTSSGLVLLCLVTFGSLVPVGCGGQGSSYVIRNDDDAPHMILYTFLMPGETDERTFTAPGSEVYSSGCGLHAASILNFTTIFVSEPGASGPAA